MTTKQDEIDLAWSLYRGDKVPREEPKVPIEGFVPRSEWLARRLEEQGGRCKYCERKIQPDHPDYEFRATTDHVIPRGSGGRDHYDNVVAACAPCNNIKGGLTLDEFLSEPKFRMRLYETRYEDL